MPQYKLIYFNAKGLAELSRLLFAYADVEYEDYRFANREEFEDQFKAKLPTGKAPVLEVDGKWYPESEAIARYLAREFKLYGKDNLESLQIDGVLETIEDVKKAMTTAFYEQDESKKAELKKKLVSDDLPAVFSVLEKIVQGDDVFVGNTITFADITFFRYMDVIFTFLENTTNILDKFPKLKSINNKVATEPKIAAWIAKRPDTAT